MAEQNQPGKYDAVLGGQSPPPIHSAVLGGIEGVQRRLSNPVVNVKLAALTDALKYGDAGLELVIQALRWEPKVLQRHAYKLLRRKEEARVKQALREYQPWDLFERLQGYIGYKGQHAERFANRQVVDYSVEVGIVDPANTAYALRSDWDGDRPSTKEQLTSLLEDSQASKLEALIFSSWYSDVAEGYDKIVNELVKAKNKLTNLKAVFLGDVHYQESEIAWIIQTDISPLLRAYPQLEVLQIRGGEGLRFNPPVRHNNLQVLIVETAGLSSETVAQICNINLPALEHLELWFGSDNYGGNCSVVNLKPIVKDLVFPDLNYLGLRNSQFADDIAAAVISYSLIETISVLDLSLGNLSDEGAELLLNCPAVNELNILNVSECCLSDEMVDNLSTLNCQLLTEKQNREADYDDEYRYYPYCAVAE